MHENPFADGVPTHFAIAATVYTAPLVELQNETKTNKSKLIFTIGGYGNGKSHALERLKNDININEKKKLAIYSSAFATKSLRGIYEQVASELLSGKYDKLETSSEGRVIMETKGIPEKIVNLFYKNNAPKSAEEMRDDLQFGKVVTSSLDVVNFLCGIATRVEQFVMLIDDIEEAASMEKGERKAFFGHIRALYDQAVRHDLNVLIILTFTPEKLDLLKEDRADLYGRVDKSRGKIWLMLLVMRK